MKIVATVRTFNESRHIDDYCKAYQFADNILIADGGSTDDTIERAMKYPKVQVKDYPVKVTMKDGSFRNPDGLTFNSLWIGQLRLVGIGLSIRTVIKDPISI